MITGNWNCRKQNCRTVGPLWDLYDFSKWLNSKVQEESNLRDWCCAVLSHSVLSDSLWPYGLQHATLPSLSITNFQSLLKLMAIQSVMPSNHLILLPPSSPASIFPSIRVFSMSQFIASGGQNTGVSASASVLPMNIQDWLPLGLTCWISLESKGLSGVFSNIVVQKHQFFGA